MSLWRFVACCPTLIVLLEHRAGTLTAAIRTLPPVLFPHFNLFNKKENRKESDISLLR